MSEQPYNPSAELARRDFEAIKSLQKNEAFATYFLRRLRDKRETAMKKFLTDPSSKCDAMQREGLRQTVLAYDDLLSMMQADEHGCTNLLGQSSSSSPAAPGR